MQRTVAEFLRTEAGGGVLLVLAALLSVVLANSRGPVLFFSSGGVMAAPVTRLGDGIEIDPPAKISPSGTPIACQSLRTGSACWWAG